MNKILYTLMTLAVLTGCTSSYNIEGTSSISTLDGRMLFLKVVKNNELKNIDSCDVVHGKFHFSGVLDSTRMASLYMDDESVMPVVLEGGDIVIKIDNTQQNVAGTPLNEKLYKFIDKHNQLDNQMNELSHKQSQMIMNGGNLDNINMKLSNEASYIASQEDKLVTSFIVDNFDNVLGPGVFMMITSSYQYPILNPWIEDIMTKATDKFKKDPYVKDYYQTAQENQNRMNGMEPAGPPPPAQQQQPTGALTNTPQ
jgi:hypothetical protein